MTGLALDELFAAVPEDFVATRDRLVRELKADGDDELAAQVKKMKRPTLATWALNQLATADADAVDAYLDASRVLRQLQERGGDRDALLGAMRTHREEQQVVADLAVGHAATRPGDPERVRSAVQETLEAAALDDAIADALRAGRLTSTERAVSAFEVLDVQPLARSKRKPTAAPARKPRVDQARVARARAALEAAERATTDARAALAGAEQAEQAAREALRRAEEPR
ncbi:MAG: hypothetical protein U0W40_14800 [Acidimicrobiia bacterium]